MDYKPGLAAASIFDGKKKACNPVLNDLFTKKTEPAVKAKVKKAAVDKKQQKPKKKEAESKTGLGKAFKEIANTTVKSDRKAGSKRKHEDTTGKETKAITPTKAKKIKRESSESTQNSKSFPFVHESLIQKDQQQKTIKVKKKKVFKKDEDDDESTGRTRLRRKRDKTNDKRTIFVGNCPLSADKKDIKGLFKDYGAIETVRFRCGPTAKLELPKRAVMIKKEFHDKASSYVCFIVFKEDESASKALEKNGYFLDGHHLRVDLASNQKQHDKRKSVFVGNLPFTVTEEDLRSHFEDCGVILNVRVVRDRQTSIGKGIAYIQFDSKDGVLLAQKLNDIEFQERKLRVMRCSSKAKIKANAEDNPKASTGNPRMAKTKAQSKPLTFQGKAKDYYSRSDPQPKKRKINFAPTNKSSNAKSFKDIFDAKKEKRVDKMKKRRQGSQKTDGLSSIFGDISADMKKLQTDNPKILGKIKKAKDKKKEKKEKKKLKKKGKGS